MIETNPLGGATIAQSQLANPAPSSPETVDYEAFLQLLVAQLKTQDPTDPTDSAEFFSQLASFSSVEQQIQINNKLESLLTASQLGEATNLIGKSLSYTTGETVGVVKSVRIDANSQIMAELHNGNVIAVKDGIIISDE